MESLEKEVPNAAEEAKSYECQCQAKQINDKNMPAYQVFIEVNDKNHGRRPMKRRFFMLLGGAGVRPRYTN